MEWMLRNEDYVSYVSSEVALCNEGLERSRWCNEGYSKAAAVRCADHKGCALLVSCSCLARGNSEWSSKPRPLFDVGVISELSDHVVSVVPDFRHFLFQHRN